MTWAYQWLPLTDALVYIHPHAHRWRQSLKEARGPQNSSGFVHGCFLRRQIWHGRLTAIFVLPSRDRLLPPPLSPFFLRSSSSFFSTYLLRRMREVLFSEENSKWFLKQSLHFGETDCASSAKRRVSCFRSFHHPTFRGFLRDLVLKNLKHFHSSLFLKPASKLVSLLRFCVRFFLLFFCAAFCACNWPR